MSKKENVQTTTTVTHVTPHYMLSPKSCYPLWTTSEAVGDGLGARFY